MLKTFAWQARKLRQALHEQIGGEKDSTVRHELICADAHVSLAQHHHHAGCTSLALNAMEQASAAIQFGLLIRNLRARPAI